MNASVAQTTFGAAGIPDVQENLPQVLNEGECHSFIRYTCVAKSASELATGTCSITIDTTAPDDTASWYDLWQAAVALDGMCARAGKAGKSRFLGECVQIRCWFFKTEWAYRCLKAPVGSW